MKSNQILTSTILTAGIAATCLALPVAAAGDTHTGNATVKLQYVRGVLQNGSPDPAHDAACKKQLSSPNSRFVGMQVQTQYSIDTQTLMMSARSTFPSPQSLQPLELNVDLNPLGIAGSYSFGAFRPAALPDSYVFFSISTKFTGATSTFLVLGTKGQTYNCMISSTKAAFKTPESAKFGSDENSK